MANMITLTVGDDITTEMFQSYINNEAYSQIDLRDILPVRPIEMTQKQLEVFNIAKERAKNNRYDFIYFIDILDTESKAHNYVFYDKLMEFRNDARYLMQAWLHPETIKVVDSDI